MCRAMNKEKQLIDRLEAQHSLSIEEYEYLIENQSDELAAYAAEKAVTLRKQVYGTDVYIRGLIEIGETTAITAVFDVPILRVTAID